MHMNSFLCLGSCPSLQQRVPADLRTLRSPQQRETHSAGCSSTLLHHMALASRLCHRQLSSRCTVVRSSEGSGASLLPVQSHSLHAALILPLPVRRMRGACRAGSESTGRLEAKRANLGMQLYIRMRIAEVVFASAGHSAANVMGKPCTHDAEWCAACCRWRGQHRVALQGGAAEARPDRRCGESQRPRGIRQAQHLQCAGNRTAAQTLPCSGSLYTVIPSCVSVSYGPCDSCVQGRSRRCRSFGVRQTGPMLISLSARGSSTQRASRHARQFAVSCWLTWARA
jgi:hypothetical protein